MLKHILNFPIRHTLLSVLSIIFMALAGTAFADPSGPAVDWMVSPSSSAVEIDTFEQVINALDSSQDEALIRLAEKARATLDASLSNDPEAFIAARAVFEHYRNGLGSESQERLRITVEMIQPVEEDPFAAATRSVLQKVNVVDGCGAELTCLDGSKIACTCATSSGVCSYNKGSNAWGGSVSCDCAGTAYDRSLACAPCNLPAPAYITGPDLCQGSVETYKTTAVSGATNYRWEIVSTPIVRNTSTPIVSISGHYFHTAPTGVYTLRVRAERGGCYSAWRSANLVVRDNGDPLCTICDTGDRICQ